MRGSCAGDWRDKCRRKSVAGGVLPGVRYPPRILALQFDNSYARLPERFFQHVQPETAPKPALIRANVELAAALGIDVDWLHSEEALQVLAGNAVPEGAASIATAYAGHQFGGFNPQLGDGRALLLGEVVAPSGRRFDVQLKGSGRTHYSRGGDGRSPLGPVLREYIVSEAMHALGVPTTRSLAAVTTGAPVYRQEALPGAVLTRVASSHIRVGTFEFFGARGDVEALTLLVDHVLARHYPELAASGEPALALLGGVVARQAALIAQWQLIGFIHGVMNTDNSLVSGETIDYGPCAFLDDYDPAKVYSSIDRGGRYAYRNQPRIGAWNMRALARALLPLFDEGQIARVEGILESFEETFQESYKKGLGAKLGLKAAGDDDDALARDFLAAMKESATDFTLGFRRLADLAGPGSDAAGDVGELFDFPPSFADWLARWQRRLEREEQTPAERQKAMYALNPALIPRNHLVHRAILAAEEEADFAPFHTLVDALRDPFRYDRARRPLATPPRPEECITETFCGT